MSAKYINAGAGSGKTYRLTHELADLLTREDHPIKASRIILTTFTKVAAADFIRKAREVLIKEKKAPSMAAELDSALIGTVHSVCQHFVQKYWYRLNLTLPLNIITDEDKNLYVSRSAENIASDEDLKFFSDLAEKYELEADFWKEYLKTIIEMKYSFGVEDFVSSLVISCNDLKAVFTENSSGAETVLDSFLKKMTTSIKNWNTKRESKGQKPQFAKEEQEAKGLLAGGSLYKKAMKVYGWAVEGKTKDKGFWKENFAPNEYTDAIDSSERIFLSKSTGAELQYCVEKLFKLATDWEKEYTEFKGENRLLDYNDLEQKFLQILYGKDFEDIRQDIRKSYDVMMVDEFQDSNPVQIRIFRKLMELIDHVEFVGDKKQAIYGFRGTESSLVDAFIEEIPEQESLKKSYRSRPELVESSNDIFCGAFGVTKKEVFPDDPEKEYDGVSLKAEREEPAGMKEPLQLWLAPQRSSRSKKPDYSAVGKMIRDIVESKSWKVFRDKDKDGNIILEPIQYRDIALLFRNSSQIKEVVHAFREVGVPVAIQEKEFLNWAEVQLLFSLLRYIINPEDKCAKADILHLVGAETVEEVLANAAKKTTTSTEDSLFKKLLSIRDNIKYLSISEIVETVVLELDMYENTRKWGYSDTRSRNIGFIVSLALQYETQCMTMNTAATIPGFISFVSGFEAKGHPVDRTDTVKVLTYHSAKGLEWPMVIMDEMDSLTVDDQTIYKKDFSGVRPTRKNDKVLLHVFPTLLSRKPGKDFYSKAPDLPQPVMNRVNALKFFDEAKERKISEERRLLYVGFTRAKDYLVVLGTNDSSYSWPVLCGAGLFHQDHQYKSVELQSPIPELTDDTQSSIQPIVTWEVPEIKAKDEKYKNPSLLSEEKIRVSLTEVFRGEKMVQNIEKEESAECGTCVHRIFAAYRPDRDKKEMIQMADRIIEGSLLKDQLPSPESVIDSAVQFFGWLREKYGEGTPLHELPVIMKCEDGTILRGEVDLLWKLSDDRCVLVDFKSFHGSEDMAAIRAHANLHHYPDQLKAYKDTLDHGECKVCDTLIYYFVQGRVIRFEF